MREGDLLNWLGQISEQSQRAGEIIRRVYGFVRKTPAQARPADINAVVHDCVRLLQVNLRHQEVAVSLELADELPAVLVDPVQIQQVLVNLMNNAIDAAAHAAARGATDHDRFATKRDGRHRDQRGGPGPRR